MFLVPTDTPGVNIVRNVGLCGEPMNEGSHALIHYEDVRVPEEALLGGEGQAFVIAQTRLGGGRIHHAMRTIGLAQKAFDMMCERALSRETQGSLLADKQFVQGYIADSYAQLVAVPAVRALHGVGDRQVQRLQAGPEGHRHRQGRHADGAARHRLAGDAGARRARHDQRDAVLRDDPRRRRDGPGRRPDRGPQGHRRPPGPARLPAHRRHVADRVDPREDRRGPRPSTGTCSSWRSGTCDRRRPRSPGGWTTRACPARASRSSVGFISGGSQNEIYEIRRGELHGALRIPPPSAPATPRRGHPARVAHHRGARRHRRAAHRRPSPRARTPTCSAAPST